ncbi:MAG: ABC transporter permease [Chloroflexota bacterium]|nr:ABC transporter permease [Chloroflexota bacterium]
MSVHRMLVVARKEFYHIARDARLFFLVTVAPAFLLITLSYVFALDVEQVDLAIQNLDNASLSRDLISHITADGDFVVVAWLMPGQSIAPLFTQDLVDIVLVIPPHFSEKVLEGTTAQLQCVVDGVDALAASQSLAVLEGRVSGFVRDLARSRRGLGVGAITALDVLEVGERAWYNNALKSLVSMVPGLMAVVLGMPALALALALAREKEIGSFESLIVTPVRGLEYLGGKLLTYVLSGVVSGMLAWIVATRWFGVPFRGELVGFLLLTADYVAASMGISLLVANFVRNQQTAMFLVLMIFFIPSFFLSGLLRPVAEEPVARTVAYALPSTHYITISRAFFLKGLGVTALRGPALALLGISLVCQIISLRLFDKKLA